MIPEPRIETTLECPENCADAQITQWKALIDNVPYIAMIAMGAAIVGLSFSSAFWQWSLAAGYIVYGASGSLWIMLFVCPWCHFYGTKLCPCGYGQISARLRAKRDGEDFARRFKQHIPVIVPLWFLPPIAGGIALYGEFSWLLVILLAAFAVNSFVILPLLSKHYGCAACPQKATCPWMGGCRSA